MHMKQAHHDGLFSFTEIIMMKFIVFAITFISSAYVEGSVGDFMWVNPEDTKSGAMFKAGTSVDLKWKIAPDSLSKPDNCTIRIRGGSWDNPTLPWTKIADEIDCTGTFTWDIPKNFVAGRQYV